MSNMSSILPGHEVTFRRVKPKSVVNYLLAPEFLGKMRSYLLLAFVAVGE